MRFDGFKPSQLSSRSNTNTVLEGYGGQVSDHMRSPQSMHEVDDRLQSFSGLENSVGFQALKRAQQEALNLRSATEAFTHQFEKQPDDGSITTTSDHHRHTSD